MAHFVGGDVWVCGMGSRGDAQPLLALAAGLRDAGHQTLYLGNDDHAALASAVGVPFQAIMWDFTAFLDGRTESGPAYRDRMAQGDTLGAVREQRRHNARFWGPHVKRFDDMLKDQKPDLLIYSLGVTALACLASTKYGVPLLPAYVQMPPYRNCRSPPPGLGLPTLPCGLNGVWFSLISSALWGTVLKHDGRTVQKAVGVDPMASVGKSNWEADFTIRRKVAHPCLVGTSPLIRELYHSEPPPQLRITGSWMLSEYIQLGGGNPFGGVEVKRRLDSFLGDGDAIYVGWGSMTCLSTEQMTGLAVAALQHAGKRGIVLGDRSDLPSKGPTWGNLAKYSEKNILFLKSAPHAWLFPRCEAIVHHGGAGTTAASLRSGRPTIITPFVGDQPTHSLWVNRLGVGIGFSKKLATIRPEELGDAILKVTSDEKVQSCARKVGEITSKENGVENAVKVVEEQLELIRHDRSHPAASGMHGVVLQP
uniref:Erythromycin biosynthesis protein CIII-like C-terminal domain-containing protein n=1 Tax=Trieres chinensis TaxID=1514140 RepID=A0A7S1YTA4_TRICV